MNHELKIHPKHYRGVLLGLKKVEIRLNDRDYKVGDLLLLNEYDPETQKYSGCQVIRKIDLIIKDVVGLDPGYVALQISKPLSV
jgi:hypothetical protein